MTGLAPFWRYYGGKNRAARLYPRPQHDTIVEPFAGAAGYSCLHFRRKVLLIDASEIVASVWRYLIAVSASEVFKLPDIPEGGTCNDVAACQEARWLMGFWCNSGTALPRLAPSVRVTQYGQTPKRGNWSGWGWRARQRIGAQVDCIRHWQVWCGDYRTAPDIEATWHIDPPYDNSAGAQYPQQPDDFIELGRWCQGRRGQVMVCENDGATWLPFKPFATVNANSRHTKRSREVMWTNQPDKQLTLWGNQ